MAQTSGQLPQGSLTGPAKLEAVTKLMNRLTADLREDNIPPQERDTLLEELKIYGRDPRNADPIFTNEGIETLTRHAFDSSSSTTSRNALRCLANAMLLKPQARQIFVDLGYESKACDKLENDNRDDEFLVSRVLFLTSYTTNINWTTLIDEHRLAERVVQNLERHAKGLDSRSGKNTVDPMEAMALAETAKLLFNITHFCEARVGAFAGAVPHIKALLLGLDLTPANPLDPPMGPLVNALLNLNLATDEAKSALFPEDKPTAVTERLVQILEASASRYRDNEIEQTVTPLVSLFRILQDVGPESVRQFIREKCLPTEQDRENVLGRGNSISSWLLRNSSNAVAPEFRKASSHLLFEMSDKDASKFVENVGYGFASGFLFQNSIPVPENASQTFTTGDSEGSRRVINPVTGQYIDTEKFADLPEMTQEEKEREAERLFDLFERLKRTGVVSVENPVETAIREGRFNDIDDADRIEELD